MIVIQLAQKTAKKVSLQTSFILVFLKGKYLHRQELLTQTIHVIGQFQRNPTILAYEIRLGKLKYSIALGVRRPRGLTIIC